MDDFYREYIVDHYRNPRNYGTIEDADISHEEHNPVCGDRVHLDLTVEDNRIVDIRFSGDGCAISQAAASMLTEMVDGHTLEEARTISKEDVLEQLGIELGPVRLKCALLALKVLKVGAYGLQGWSGDDEDDW